MWSTGGGFSTVYTKPSWQVGTGVPADGKRDVPDISLTAAGHDGYLIFMNGTLGSVGGTSAASPAFAGLMALVLQNAGTRQGQANTTFYALAAKQQSGGTAIFHDTLAGNNSVPGVTGYTANPGYDLATGLGSVDGNMLVTHWSDATSVPGFQVAVDSSAMTMRTGSAAAVYFTSSINGGFNAAISFSATGLPAGVTASFTPATFAAPGSGRGTMTVTAGSAAKAGSYLISVAGTSGGITKSVPFTINVTPAADYTLALSATSLNISAGKTGAINLTTTANTGFNSAIGFSLGGLPSGITAVFSKASIAAPGSGVSTLTFSAAKTVAAGTYSVIITATGGGITHPQSLAINVPGFTLTTAKAAVSLDAGAKTSIALTTRALGGFTSLVKLSLSGAPAGVSVSLSPQPDGSSVLTITRGPTAKAATSNIIVTATGGGMTKTSRISITVKK
jgi:hypothetical protein